MSSKKPRGILIAGNWKLNHGLKETEQFFSEIRSRSHVLLNLATKSLFQSGQLRACIFPPMLSLTQARDLAAGLEFPMVVGAQNAHWEKKGAFTGEVSGPMLEEQGIHWVLIGHSERRQHFGETDETAKLRSESLLDQGFKVVLCVGETRTEREAGQTREVLLKQLLGAIQTDKHLGGGNLIVAYEPVWAIGTGLTATPEQAEEAHIMVREDIASRFGAELAVRVPVLYGGSVTPENIDSLLACPNVDGGLVGGASLKPDSFLALLAAGERAL